MRNTEITLCSNIRREGGSNNVVCSSVVQCPPFNRKADWSMSDYWVILLWRCFGKSANLNGHGKAKLQVSAGGCNLYVVAGNLHGEDGAHMRLYEDMFIRRFISGTFYRMLAGELGESSEAWVICLFFNDDFPAYVILKFSCCSLFCLIKNCLSPVSRFYLTKSAPVQCFFKVFWGTKTVSQIPPTVSQNIVTWDHINGERSLKFLQAVS